MISLANDLLDGYIYFLESDAVRNQNWAPTVANIDLATNYTEGLEFCKLKLPKQWIKKMGTGITIDDASGGSSYMTRTSRKSYLCTIIALEVVGSDVEKIEQFIMDADHTASSGSTFKQYYMIIRRSVSDYELFTDASDTRQDYCKGAILEFEITWHESQSRVATIRIMFRSNW